MSNKKGMTIIELLLSIVLISLVLTFIMQLYLRARNAYINNSVNAKYELSKSIIIDAVTSDFLQYDLDFIYDRFIRRNYLEFNFVRDEFIPVTKHLEVVEQDDAYLVIYSGGYDEPIIVREYLKSDVTFKGISKFQRLTYDDNGNVKYGVVIYNLKFVGTDGIDYTINLYCPINN